MKQYFPTGADFAPLPRGRLTVSADVFVPTEGGYYRHLVGEDQGKAATRHRAQGGTCNDDPASGGSGVKGNPDLVVPRPSHSAGKQ